MQEQPKDLTVMFVDDDLEVIKMVEGYAKLKTHDHTFFMVKLGGWAALNYLKRWKYAVDVVVMDLKMPDMGGLKLTQRIREGELRHNAGPLKIFWYTGLRFDQNDRFDPYTVSMTENNVEKVFNKPYPVTDLIDEVIEITRNC